MSPITQTCILVVLVFAFLYPIDFVNIGSYAWLWVATRALNYYLMFRAYMMYRQLKSDLGKMGMPMPAFKFIPIWERNGNQKDS